MSTLHNPRERKPDLVSSSEETTEYFFRQAIEAEDLARDIYVQFAQMFFHVPDISGFWQGLGYDEAKHAFTLKKAQASLSIEQLAAPADRKLLSMIANTISLLNMISLETIKTLDNAFEAAHEIEFSELNYVFKYVVSDFIAGESRKKILFDEIEGHQKKLVDFSENFGDRTWRKQVPARSTTTITSER